MTTSNIDFNLVDEPWVPILLHNGKVERYGIRETLLKAGNIRQLACSNPMDRAALLRFLLAVLYWCRGNPQDGDHEKCVAGIPEEWLGKLEEHRECFNLLGDGKRFLQYQKPGEKANKLAANYLIQEVPTGSNVSHFRHAVDKQDGLCPACAAMGLLRLAMFATSGGRGKPPGINSRPPLYAFWIGNSLSETLMLHWQASANLGTPQWVDPGKHVPSIGSVPLLVGLTWVPRRVWLTDSEAKTDRCISCGIECQPITQMVFASIGSQKTDEDSPGREWKDPHVLYEQHDSKGQLSLYASDALKNSNGAAGQRLRVHAGLLKDFAQQGNTGTENLMDCIKRNSWVVGFATVQNDKYLEALEWTFAGLQTRDELEAALELLTAVWKSTGKQAANVGKVFKAAIQRSSGMTPSRKLAEVNALITKIAAEVEHQIAAISEQIANRELDIEQFSQTKFKTMMRSIVGSLVPGQSVDSCITRQQLASVAPKFKSKPRIKRTPRDGGQ